MTIYLFSFQIGASLIESNEFIIHVLNKFNLLDWAAADFEQKTIEDDTLRHTISMVEEFLSLLITSRHIILDISWGNRIATILFM